MTVWKFLAQKLSAQINCILMIVVESKGSSPGRQGFKMGIAADGTFIGSIGGGIMEHKMVEKAKALLQKREEVFLLQKQFHHKQVNQNQSGLICSGEQQLLLLSIPDPSIFLQIAAKLEASIKLRLTIGPEYIEVEENVSSKSDALIFQYNTEQDWFYQEELNYQETIHIIGAGHVSLALSKQMKLLNFKVKVYDDRPKIKTLLQNDFADEKRVVDYQEIAQQLPSNPNDFVVIMSFGYRSDKLILKALKNHQFRYIGMMGSDHKIQQLYQEYEEEGILREDLKHVSAPIGLNIYSRTPEEIAVSIAAEIIQVKNRNLPGGRT